MAGISERKDDTAVFPIACYGRWIEVSRREKSSLVLTEEKVVEEEESVVVLVVFISHC